MIGAAIFDVFGTVVDWRRGVADAVAAAYAARGRDLDASAFADAWRAEYDPAMAPIREGARPYVPLDLLHRENLVRVLARRGELGLFDDAALDDLTRAWERLPPWHDSVAGIADIRRICPVAPCSNGSIALMLRLARHTGLTWDCILGADIARSYKPDGAVYRAACAALGLAPDRVLMVAAHGADLAAAQAQGLRTAFIPRPDEHGRGRAEPPGPWDFTAPDLIALAAQLG